MTERSTYMKMSLKDTTFIKRCGLQRLVKCWKTSRLLDAYFWQFWTTSKIALNIELSELRLFEEVYSTLIGQFISSTYYVRVRNRASTCLTNESILQEAKKSRFLKLYALLKLLFNIGDLYQKNDYYHSTSKSRRLYFGLN